MLSCNTLIIAIMTIYSALMNILKLVSYAVWHALHACILKLNHLLFISKNTKIIKFCSSNQYPLNLLSNIGLQSPGVPYGALWELRHNSALHHTMFCIQSNCLVLKTANGNLRNRTGFTLYLTLSSINIQGHRQKNFKEKMEATEKTRPTNSTFKPPCTLSVSCIKKSRWATASLFFISIMSH